MEETNIKNASRHMSEGQITIDGISYRIGKIYYSVGDDAFGNYAESVFSFGVVSTGSISQEPKFFLYSACLRVPKTQNAEAIEHDYHTEHCEVSCEEIIMRVSSIVSRVKKVHTETDKSELTNPLSVQQKCKRLFDSQLIFII